MEIVKAIILRRKTCLFTSQKHSFQSVKAIILQCKSYAFTTFFHSKGFSDEYL